MSLSLSSPSFSHGSAMPSKFTCEGADVSPALAWTGVPAGAKSLALVVDDPDAPDPRAPQRTWVHWIVVDLPPDAHGLGEDVAKHGLPPGARAGMNDWNRAGWGGPCPPIGRHRYFFKLYALDTTLTALVSPAKAELEKAMRGHVLAQQELVGTYEKRGGD